MSGPFTPGGNPFLPKAPVAPRPGPILPDRALLSSVLREEESPSPFESLFRFLGRPSYAVRSALRGDIGGAARNMAQMGLTVMQPLSIMNPSTGLLAPFGSQDLTEQKHRPEFSDLLESWGAIANTNDLGTWEKFALDVGGGIITDPLTLVGGGAKTAGVVAGKLGVGTASKAGQVLASGIRAGGGRALNQALDSQLIQRMSTYTGRLARRAVTTAEPLPHLAGPPVSGPLTRVQALSQVRGQLDDLVRMGATTPQRAALMERALTGQAAADVFFDSARKVGVDLRRGRGFLPSSALAEGPPSPDLQAPAPIDPVASWDLGLDSLDEVATGVGPKATRMFSVLPRGMTVADPEVARRVSQGGVRRIPAPWSGEGLDILHSTDNQQVANRVLDEMRLASADLAPFHRGTLAAQVPAQAPPGALHRMLNVMRDLGYDDKFSQALLQDRYGGNLGPQVAGLFDSIDEWMRLGQALPSSLESEGMEAMARAGMAPGGGLTFNPLWSDRLGRAAERLTGWKYRPKFDPTTGTESSGYVFVPWSAIGNATIPGMLRQQAHAMGWKGVMVAEEAAGKFGNWLVRKFYDRLIFGKEAFTNSEAYGKAAAAAENVVRTLKVAHDAAVNQLPVAVRNAMSAVPRDARETLTARTFAKEQDFQTMIHDLRANPQRVWSEDVFVPALESLALHAESEVPTLRKGAQASRRLLDQIHARETATSQARADLQFAAEEVTRLQGQEDLIADVRNALRDYNQSTVRRMARLRAVEAGPALYNRLAPLEQSLGVARSAYEHALEAAGYSDEGVAHTFRNPEALINQAHNLRDGDPLPPAIQALEDQLSDLPPMNPDFEGPYVPLQDLNDGDLPVQELQEMINARALQNAQGLELEMNTAASTRNQSLRDIAENATDPLTHQAGAYYGSLQETTGEATLDEITDHLRQSLAVHTEAARTNYEHVLARAQAAGFTPGGGGWLDQFRAAGGLLDSSQARLEVDIQNALQARGSRQEALRGIDAPYHAEFEALLNERVEDLFVGELTKELIDEVAALHPNVPREALEKAVKYSQEEMRKVAAYMRFGAKNSADLAHGATHLRPAYPEDSVNPFYLPHQMDPRVVEMLSRADLTTDQIAGLRSVLDQRRNYRTIDEFYEAVTNTADSLGIDHNDVTEIVQHDFAALTLQRLLAFERVKFTNQAHQEILKIAGKLGGPLSVYQDYLKGALHPVQPHKVSPILKFMSGGNLSFETKTDLTGLVKNLNRSFDMPETGPQAFATIRASGGGFGVNLRWPGLNSVWKPLLTSQPFNVRFRFRNNVSSPLQLALHPDMGKTETKAFLDVLRNDGLVRWGIRKFSGRWGNWTQPLGAAADIPPGTFPDSARLAAMTPDQRTAWATRSLTIAFTAPAEAERLVAREALSQFHDLKIGPYTFKEAFQIIDSVAGPHTPNGVSLGQGLDDLGELLGVINKPMHHDPNLMGKTMRHLQNFVRFGERLSNESENQWRILGALKFLEQGKTPVEVVQSVNRMFVDYSRQSELEGWLRAFIPFARFMVGSSGWVKDLAANPSGAGKGLIGRMTSLQSLGTAQRAMTSGEEDPMVPSYVKETISLPLPWKDEEGNRSFLVSLGFPQEVVINMLALASGRPESIRRVGLGALHPAVKLPAEAITGRSFYFGTDFGSYRKAPAVMEPFATEVPGPNGEVRYEIPGVLNEVMNALPTAGMDATLNRLADDRRSIAGRLVNALTGFQTQSVDQEAELQRRISDYLYDQVKSGTVGELKVFFERLRPEDVPEEVRTVLDQLERIRAEKRRKAK